MIKNLAKSMREYWKPAVLSPTFIAGEVILEVMIPYFTGRLISNGVEAKDMSTIWRYAIILLIMAVASLSCGALSGYFCAKAGSGFAKNLRHDLYYNVQDFSFTNIDKYSSSSLVTRLTTDVTNIQNAFQMIIRTAIRCPLMLIISMVMSFKTGGPLALVFLGVLPVMGIALFIIIKYTHPIFEKVFKTYDKLNNVVSENLSAVRVVKSFVRQDYEIEKFNAVSGDIYRLFSKAERNLALNAPIMMGTVYVCMMVISWFSAKRIVVGKMDIGDMTSMLSYVMMVLMSLMMLSMVFVMIVISRASIERVNEVLTEKSDLTNGDHPIYDVPDGSISFKNVSFSYSGDPEKLCLMDVDLDIKSGQTIGILGGTGTSKSTLVQLIPRLYDVTEGQVLVGGIDVREYDIETLRNSVSMVLQKNVLFSGTIKENLRWGNPDATDEQMEHACRLAQAHDFIMEFPDGYDTYIEQGGTNVSGGQKQRLCIARALLKNPKILIMDDSTSAVDTKTDSLIRTAMRTEIPNVTKLIIAQRVTSVMDADKIIVMENGRVEAFGTHKELLDSCEIYREVYESQQKGSEEDE